MGKQNRRSTVPYKKEMMHEREEAAKVNGEEAKVGLE